jgi:hypothetical protein
MIFKVNILKNKYILNSYYKHCLVESHGAGRAPGLRRAGGDRGKV